MKRKSDNPASKCRDKCVILAKKIVRHQSNYTCAYCGKSEPEVHTHGSHIYAEGINRAMSADLDNILCICSVHHLAHSYWNSANHWSWHGTPIEAHNWFKAKYPERAKVLLARSRIQQQADLFFWQKKLAELKKIAAEIGL